MSISLIGARTLRTQTRDGGNSDAILSQASLLDSYALLSLTELLDEGKAEEAWDIIGQLYDAIFSEDGGVDTPLAGQILQKIENYKQAEQAALAGSRSKQITPSKQIKG